MQRTRLEKKPQTTGMLTVIVYNCFRVLFRELFRFHVRIASLLSFGTVLSCLRTNQSQGSEAAFLCLLTGAAAGKCDPTLVAPAAAPATDISQFIVIC